ncbi:MAG TPA: hypothetical protein VKB23_14185 [Solirubrobacterales bacterium]|nr:hypothetical protein [Solirubrobacterales bacterium]
MVVMTPRESWTDTRLDEFAKRIDERFDDVDRRFDEVNQRFAQVDQRFAQMDRRFETLEMKMEAGFAAVNGRIDRLTLVLIVGLISLIATQL